MLKYHGHHFFDGAGACACCAGDQRVVAVDPTGTEGLRRAFYSSAMIKWRGLRVLARRAIVDQDILSLGAKGLMNVANPAIMGGATRTQMFQRWFDTMLGAQVLQGDGSWMRDYIRRGYEAGRAFAQQEVGRYVSRYENDRIETLFQLAVVELQGIIEAVSQQGVRAVANGLLHGLRPLRIARDTARAVDKTASQRTQVLVELIVVKAFGEASLDVYEAAGVQRVGLLPEAVARPISDARSRKVAPTGRAGTRSRRQGKAPGLRTIQRIKRHEREVEALTGGLVRVRTAGDERVCKKCETIAKAGPYRINRARQLIPAHPRCRCVFVPARKATKDAGRRDMQTGRYIETGEIKHTEGLTFRVRPNAETGHAQYEIDRNKRGKKTRRHAPHRPASREGKRGD